MKPRHEKCRVSACQASAAWRSCSVGDFMKDNPGWLWVADADGGSFVLCPDHATAAIKLADELRAIVGDYAVNPMLRRKA